jgi:hypothetical protein
MDKAAAAKVCVGGRGEGVGRGVVGGAGDQQSRLINILFQFYTVLYMEMRGIYIHYIEQIIYENTHIQLLMFNKKLMKRNKVKTKNYLM